MIITKRRFWTKEEDDFLRENYLLFPNKVLAEKLNRPSANSVQIRAVALGIKLKGHRNAHEGSREWTKEELDYIKENGGKLRAYEIARNLNRSYASIHHRLQRSGVVGWKKKSSGFSRKRNYNIWSWRRKKIEERDGGLCKVCGYSKHINVHHITPIHMGGSDADNNLITLCPNCHAEADAKEISRETLYNLIGSNYGQDESGTHN